MTPANKPQPTPDAADPKPRLKWPRWGRRIGIGLLILIVLILGLVAFAPTIASTGPVRSAVVARLGPVVAPNGKLEISSWSFGWFGPQSVNGIRLYDNQNAAILDANFRTGLKLTGALGGSYDLGDTVVDLSLNKIEIDPETGACNLKDVMGVSDRSPTPEPGDSKPAAGGEIQIPAVTGKLTVNLTGSIASSNRARPLPVVRIEPGSKLVVDLNDLKNALLLESDIKLLVDGKPASFTLKGSVDAIENNIVVTDPNQISADLAATIHSLDATIVQAVLALAGIDDVTIHSGQISGRLIARATPGGDASVKTENLRATNLNLAGSALAGDSLSLPAVEIPIDIERKGDRILIRSSDIDAGLASIKVAGDLSQSGLLQLADGKPTSPAGNISVTLAMPSLPGVAKQLPNTLRIKPGVEITAGEFASTVKIDLPGPQAKVATSTKLFASGTDNGRAISLEPITLDADATLDVSDQNVTPADVIETSIALVAPFADIRGGGSLRAFNLDGRYDITQLANKARQFADLGDLVLEGRGTIRLTAAGDLADTTKPIDITLATTASDLNVKIGGQTLLDREGVNLQTAAAVTAGETKTDVTISTFTLDTTSGLFRAKKVGDPPARVTLDSNSPLPAGDLTLDIAADAARIAKIAAPQTPPENAITSGKLAGVVSLKTDSAAKVIRISPNFELTQLTVGNALRNESVKFAANVVAPEALNAVTVSASAECSFATFVLDETNLTLKDASGNATPPLKMLAGPATFSLDVTSLPKLMAIAEATGTKLEVDGQPVRIESGSLALAGRIEPAADSIRFNLRTVNERPPLAMSRSGVRYAPTTPIKLNVDAVANVDPTKAEVAEQIHSVVINALRLELADGLLVENKSPITVTEPAGAMWATGTLEINGLFGSLSPLAEVFAGEPLPVTGSFTSVLTATSTAGGVFTVDGATVLRKLRSIDPNSKLPFDEFRVEQTASIDPADKVLSLTKLLAFSPQSDAIRLAAAGTIRDWANARAFEKLNVTLDYDAAKLLQVYASIVDAETRRSLEGVIVEGKYRKTFVIDGSFPATRGGRELAFNESIRSLIVSGDLQLDRVAASGLEMTNAQIPILLKGGAATFAFADGRPAPDITVNDGTLRLAGIAVDLTQGEEPILGKLRDHPLLSNVSINPVLANSLGKYFNPIFPNSTKARGLLDVTLTSDGVKLGESLKTADSGRAVLRLSLREMEIANPLGESLFGGVINQAAGKIGLGGVNTADYTNFAGELRGATFTLDRGVITQNATFMIGNTGALNADGSPKLYPLSFSGDVRLADLSMNLNAGLPMQIIKNKLTSGDLGKFMQFMPDSMPVRFTGTTTAPRLGFDALGKSLTEALTRFGASKLLGSDRGGDVGQIIGGVLGGQKSGGEKNENAEKTDAEKIGDLLIGIFGGQTKDEKKDDRTNP